MLILSSKGIMCLHLKWWYKQYTQCVIKWIKSDYKIIIIKQYCSFMFENDYECKRKYLKSSKCFKMLIVQQWLFSKAVIMLIFFTFSFIFSIFKWWYRIYKDFPGGPVVKNPPLQCRRHEFNPWLGNHNSHMPQSKQLNVCHNYWACEPQPDNPWATAKKYHMLQLRPDAANK